MQKHKRTLLAGVLFCACLFFAGRSAAACPPAQIHESVRVKYVHDGDTVRLSDGRKVRLIGLDTPELARDGRPAQPYAMEARNVLDRLLEQHDYRVGLGFGSDRKDRYQRTLAHLYLPGGESIQAILLRGGYATAFTTPPNDRMNDCYRAEEAKAIKQQRGIWGLARYQPRTPAQLGSSEKGFRRIQGKITAVNQGKRAWWMIMPIDHSRKIKIRIDQKDLAYFDTYSLSRLKDKTVRIRGWIHPRKDGFFIALRHPSALTIEPK